MYFAPKKVGKKASEAVDNQLKKKFVAPKKDTKKAAPKNAAPAKEEKPKKKGFSFGKL